MSKIQGKSQKSEDSFRAFLKKEAAALTMTVFVILFLANPVEAGFFDWMKGLFTGPQTPIERTEGAGAASHEGTTGTPADTAVAPVGTTTTPATAPEPTPTPAPTPVLKPEPLPPVSTPTPVPAPVEGERLKKPPPTFYCNVLRRDLEETPAAREKCQKAMDEQNRKEEERRGMKQEEQFRKESEESKRRDEERMRGDEERMREEEQRRGEERRFEDEKRGEENRRFEEERQRREEDFRRRDDEQKFEDERQREEERRGAEEELRREEEERHMDDRRFQDMKRGVNEFLRGADRMEREIERMKKKLERCALTIPAHITDAVAKARSIASRVEAAKTADELEDIMFELEEVGYEMQEWGPRIGEFHRACDMLEGATRELKRLERDHAMLEKRAASRKIDVAIPLAKLREIKRKMDNALTEARTLAETSAEEAANHLEENIFLQMEAYHNARQAVEMALNMSQGLKDADREIREFEQRIKEIEKSGKNTSQMKSLLSLLKQLKKKLDVLVAQGAVDPSAVRDLMEEAFKVREELITRLSHREGGLFKKEKEEREDEFDVEPELEEEEFALPEGFETDARRRAVFEVREKGGVADAQVQTIKEKAGLLAQDKLDQILGELQQLRDVVKEQEAELKFLKNLSGDLKKLSAQMQENINGFVAYGVDENSQKLGAGERAAVLHSYEAAYGALPDNEKGLEDMIKIVNGRFPSQRSPVAEKHARKVFQSIFKRAANLNNDNDNAAIMVMAYGLRQSAKNRNLESEKKGITTFRAIFNKVPQTTEEWNTMQAITYSGAVRKPDRDKDFLADDDEAVFGTNPDVADTDGDGIPDGVEVDEGFDPLQK